MNTRDEIIRMAREVKIECDLIDEDEGQVWYITTETLERFFHAAYAAGAKAEREACAKVCEELGWNAANWCAKAIRARGEK